MTLFDTVLVANRGEIARRVIRTLRALGIRSVAIYSDADADAPHVREADAAVRVGPAAASASYLDIDAVIAAAVRGGAGAIHPGYGFLSENAAFARACADAGIVFVGPGERALEVMADKIRARDHVAAHGVPIVPGFSAAGMDDDQIVAAAERAGFPLLIKPSAGGGGKGMQVVRGAAELPEALATARRVATAAFGDDTLLLERLIERPRHIEVQILADAHGRVIHLGERECTLQRRHQKVMEEAPSVVVDAAIRERIGTAACAAAASVDYRGAGTVEFLVAADRPDEFFFIEMNTRLQVEHPVTELVTGVDLVEQQLRVAAGERLALTQGDIVLRGHAVEARVYAESPERGFLPATGEVLRWRPARPTLSDETGRTAVRTDAAVEAGSVVGSAYDPMIAKVIAWGEDRTTALERLDVALADTVLLGVECNIAFLRVLVSDPDVRAGRLDTGLIDRLPPFVPPPPSAPALIAAANAVPRSRERVAHASELWRSGSGWRLGGPDAVPQQAFRTPTGVLVTGTATASAGEAEVAVARDGAIWVHADGVATPLEPLSRREAADARLAERDRTVGASDPELRSPMPGAVVAVHTVDGALVAAGDRIATIEAMKMEHPVIAPHEGFVELLVATGDQVSRGTLLARVVPRATSAPAAPDRP
ncbi:biotin carboxylase N-terminal domain-containing protein [Microbacterium sp.]|uniref:acetyl/propionyl/methylcrotonyl-CoA carboxylase subunit alpha n=1 Tax=Microbacterium sp. TaxID=51671 RepID=UPI001AC943DE|nr:biotin carboxylase N-terminal domain-containing protein [Microbacterium sp.]MBN9191179.1 ATP-grasp domain-containing protein [Microbacterium sp.]